MNGIVIVKGTLKTLSGIGVGAIVNNMTRPFIPANVSTIKQVAYGLGQMSIGCVAIEATSKYWDGLVDELVDMKTKFVEALDQAKVEVEVNKEELKKLKKETKEEKKEAKKKSKKVSKKKDNVIEVEFEETNEEA